MRIVIKRNPNNSGILTIQKWHLALNRTRNGSVDLKYGVLSLYVQHCTNPT